MSKAEEKLNDVQSKIKELETETNKRVSQLNQLVSNLREDIQSAGVKQQEADEKTGKLNNEIKLLEGNIADEKKAIEELNAKISQLNPDIESKQAKKSDLQSTISELETKKADLDREISEKESKQEELTKDKVEKSEAYKDLEASIDKDLEKNKLELNEYKQQYQKILDNNAVWEYLFEKIETPEIEIMAIIAANRGVSQDAIKAKAKNVSPVFVGRAISKLEADGKIVNNDDLWDLSPALIDVIQE